MKYCCEDFKKKYLTDKKSGPNIRIVQLKSESLISPKRNKFIKEIKKMYGGRYDLSYFITMGYQEFSLLLPTIILHFCPYCGKNLHKFYNKIEYANEIERDEFDKFDTQ